MTQDLLPITRIPRTGLPAHAVVVGDPARAAAVAALLFGLAEAAGFRLQGVGLPQQATDAAPYVVTLVALFLSTARRRRRTANSPSGATT